MTISVFDTTRDFADSTRFLASHPDANTLVLSGIRVDDVTGVRLLAQLDGHEPAALLERQNHGWCLGGAGGQTAASLAAYLFNQSAASPYFHAPKDAAEDFVAGWVQLGAPPPTLAFRFHTMVLNPDVLHQPTLPPGRFDVAAETDLVELANNSVVFYHDALGESRTHASQVDRLGPVVTEGRCRVWRDQGEITAQVEYREGADAHRAMLAFLVTPPRHRNRGYAGALVTELARDLARQDLQLSLFADADKADLIRFYSRLGFAPRATIHRYDHLHI